MKTFTIYDTSTGKIIGVTAGDIQASDVLLESGQAVLEGNHDGLEYKIVDGEAVERTDLKLEIVRPMRDDILKSCDWTQVADAPLTDEKKAEWATYRQALRDLPSKINLHTATSRGR